MTMPPGGPPAYQYPSGTYPPPPAAKTNVWAILSLIFGIVGLIGIPVSVVCGIVGLKRAKQGQGGRGLAIAGLVLSGVWVLVLAGILVGLVVHFLLSVNERGPASYFKPGDCITDIPEGAREVAIVDCRELHAGEVFAVFMLHDGDFPGQAAIREYVDKCDQELATYSPSAADDTSVSVKKRYPTEES